MKVYLSSAFMRHAELSGFAGELRALGHEVTSTWHDAEDLCRDDGHTMQATPTARAAILRHDLDGILACNAFIAFTEPAGSPYVRGSRHYELGAAMAWGKFLVLVGAPEEMLGHWQPALCCFPDWGRCLVGLKRMWGS